MSQIGKAKKLIAKICNCILLDSFPNYFKSFTIFVAPLKLNYKVNKILKIIIHEKIII